MIGETTVCAKLSILHQPSCRKADIYRPSKIIHLCPFPLLANLVCLKALVLELLGDVFADRLVSFQIGKILEPA